MNAEDRLKKLLPCSCHEAYTKRGLTSPTCAWHNYGEDVLDLLREVQRNERERFLREYHFIEHIRALPEEES